MNKVCAWCRKNLDDSSSADGDDPHPVSHGICADCARKVMETESESVASYLDRFPGPVLLVEGEGLIVAANGRGLGLLGKRAEEIRGRPGGNVFECRNAYLPGGCGKTIHCKSCTIRNTVTDTMLSGRSHIRIPAFLDTADLSGDKRIRFLISTEKSGEAVLLRIDEVDGKPMDE